MGSISSKIYETVEANAMGEYLPRTPDKPKQEETAINEELSQPDPRSPNTHIYRTPIGSPNKKTPIITKSQNLTNIKEDFATPMQNTIFKDRLLRHMNQNAFDPRSPSVMIVRTPITFNDKLQLPNETTPSVEFTEIFNDSHSFVNKNDVSDSFSQINIQSEPQILDEATILIKNDEEIVAADPIEVIKEETPTEELVIENKIITELKVSEKKDPRSPTIEIERTPIVLEDKIDLKASRIIKSFKIFDECKEGESKVANSPVIKNTQKNKKLIETKNSFLSNIYEDGENLSYGTPKKLATLAEDGRPRTPLSCVANKSNAKMLKQKINNNLRAQVYDENSKTPILVNNFNNEENRVVKSASLSGNVVKSRIPVFRQK